MKMVLRFLLAQNCITNLVETAYNISRRTKYDLRRLKWYLIRHTILVRNGIKVLGRGMARQFFKNPVECGFTIKPTFISNTEKR